MQPAVQRLTLRIGDREQQGYLDDEESAIRHDLANEVINTVPDKWGNQGESSYNPYKKLKARYYGNNEVGARRSFRPNQNQRYLANLGQNEDLRIIAHGAYSNDRVGGYTPAKFVRLLRNLGLQANYTGRIYLLACITAQPRRDGGTVLEDIYHELHNAGYACEVFGLAGAIIGGGQYETPLGTLHAEENLEKAQAKTEQRSDQLANATNYVNSPTGGWAAPWLWMRERQMRQAQNAQRQRQNELQQAQQQYGVKGDRNWIRAGALVQARQNPKVRYHWKWLFQNRQQAVV